MKPERCSGRCRVNQQKQWYHGLRWGDFVIAAIIVILAAGLFGLAAQVSARPAAAVVLLLDGQVIRTWDADRLMAGGEETLTANGLHYRLEWTEGKIRFAEADCPDQVCVLSGWVGRRGSISACVPGGLILKAVGEPQTTETDEVDVIIR